MPVSSSLIRERIAAYYRMRVRNKIGGSKPHNAALVGMSDGDWPEYTPSNTVLPG